MSYKASKSGKILHGFPGFARSHLQSWISGASIIQRFWRALRFRKNLLRGRELRSKLRDRLTRVQALWRSKKARADFLMTRRSAISLQVSTYPSHCIDLSDEVVLLS